MFRTVASIVSAKGSSSSGRSISFVRRTLATTSHTRKPLITSHSTTTQICRRRHSSLGGSNPMFPERAVPEVPTAAGAAVKDKHKISEEADFLTRHGGKVALVALSLAVGLFYTYYESGQSKNRVEDALNNEATIEPYEVNEIRFLNTLTPQLYDTLTAACLDHFTSGAATYPEFVAFVNSFLSRYNAEMAKNRSKQTPSSSSSQQQGAREAFIPSAQFVGPKAGYFFQAGANGLGYYRDSLQQRKVQRQEAESTAAVVLRGGHLFDRLVASYLVAQQQQQQQIASSSSSSSSLMSRSGDTDADADTSNEVSLVTTPLNVAYLLVALNMAERTAAPQRADSLFLLAQGVDRRLQGDVHVDPLRHHDQADSDSHSYNHSSSNSSSGSGSSNSSSSNGGSGSDSVSWAAAEEIVRHLGDSWQLPAERRVAETGVKYPIKTYRRKTAEDMVKSLVATRNKELLAKESKEGKAADQPSSPPGTDPHTTRLSKEDFRDLLLGGVVCAWAECYRAK